MWSHLVAMVKVRRACHGINEGLQVVTCGSYRRGRATCGDVDIMVTHPDGRSHKNVFQPLLQTLREEGVYVYIVFVYIVYVYIVCVYIVCVYVV